MGLEQIVAKGVSCAPEVEAVAARCLEEIAHLRNMPGKLASASEEATSRGFSPLPQKIIDAIKDQNIARELGNREREFLVIKGSVGATIDALRGSNHGAQKLLVREIPPNGLAADAVGPDLKMWVQHFAGKDGGVGINLDMARQADIIVNCHPNLLPSLYQGETLQMLQAKHVFPWSRGEVFISEFLEADSQNVMHSVVGIKGSWNNWNKVPRWT